MHRFTIKVNMHKSFLVWISEFIVHRCNCFISLLKRTWFYTNLHHMKILWQNVIMDCHCRIATSLSFKLSDLSNSLTGLEVSVNLYMHYILIRICDHLIHLFSCTRLGYFDYSDLQLYDIFISEVDFPGHISWQVLKIVFWSLQIWKFSGGAPPPPARLLPSWPAIMNPTPITKNLTTALPIIFFLSQTPLTYTNR